MTRQMIITTIVIPLVIIIFGFLIALLNIYVQKLKSQTDSIKNREKRDMINTYIDWAEDVVETIVYTLKYTIVDGLKATGNWDAATGKSILENAKTQIADSLTNDIKAAILMVNNDFGKWSEDLIEYFVGKSKENNNPVTPIPVGKSDGSTE